MKIEIFQTRDEMDVIKMECYLIQKMINKGELKGDLAEVGVYEGGSVDIIRKEIPDQMFHIFDTFTGLPNTMVKGLDADSYYEGHMEVDFEKIKYHYKDVKNLKIYKGYFPDTAGPIEDKKFAFVHIDTDIYQSTRDALMFFYPRMEIGGSMIMHDYPAHAGVKKAIDELMDGVGTHYHSKWKVWGKDPLIQSGFRQLIIRRRVKGLELNLYVEPPPKYPRVYDNDGEHNEIIDKINEKK